MALDSSTGADGDAGRSRHLGSQFHHDAMSAQNMQIIMDGQWTGGVDSFLDPADLVQGSYAWGVNIVNAGGGVQNRPAKRRVKNFFGRKTQSPFWARTLDDRNN